MTRSFAFMLSLGISQLVAAPFGEQKSTQGIRHSFLIAGHPTAIVDEDSHIKWQTTGRSRDGFVLENGNVLICNLKDVREYQADGSFKTIYTLSPENAELSTAQPLKNGNTLVVECGKKPQLLEIDSEGKIAITVPLQPETDNSHMQTRMARKLGNGNYLVPHLLAFAIKEYKPDGSVVKTIKTDTEALGGKAAKNWPFTAIRLDNGNTLSTLTHGNKVVEFNPSGEVVWKLDNENSSAQLADPCGAQRLDNGNTIISSFGQHDGSKPKIIEVTPSREVVWEFYHPGVQAHEIHVISTNKETTNTTLK
ncbi:hypothetical protein [Rubritalea marina]|uniref:beta-propeller domain-containing protein n=1 Tax=Rubritalea marina TaxID=361055 RepID=UPI00035FD500|nr:hypothetical protein [Rubritalea marina]